MVCYGQVKLDESQSQKRPFKSFLKCHDQDHGLGGGADARKCTTRSIRTVLEEMQTIEIDVCA